MTQREIDSLNPEQCLELLTQQVVGRIIFVDEQGPGAVPVNYAVAGGEIILRVAEDSHLRALIQKPIGFEADYTNADQSEGWSVLVRGSGREIPMTEVPQILKALMRMGRMPNFKKLAAMGSFTELGTTMPALSPVAWSSFITGMTPGGHGIPDFIARNPKTYMPFFSIYETRDPEWVMSLGDY